MRSSTHSLLSLKLQPGYSPVLGNQTPTSNSYWLDASFHPLIQQIPSECLPCTAPWWAARIKAQLLPSRDLKSRRGDRQHSRKSINVMIRHHERKQKWRGREEGDSEKTSPRRRSFSWDRNHENKTAGKDNSKRKELITKALKKEEFGVFKRRRRRRERRRRKKEETRKKEEEEERRSVGLECNKQEEVPHDDVSSNDCICFMCARRWSKFPLLCKPHRNLSR